MFARTTAVPEKRYASQLNYVMALPKFNYGSIKSHYLGKKGPTVQYSMRLHCREDDAEQKTWLWFSFKLDCFIRIIWH